MTDQSNRMQACLADMLEATKLTGAGRIQEATALLQRALDGTPTPTSTLPSPSETPGSPRTIDLAAQRSETSPSPSVPAMQAGRADDAMLQAILPERLREVLSTVVRGLGRGVAPVLKGLQGETPPGPVPGGPAPTPGGFVECAFSNAAGARDYKLYVPTRQGRDLPLVVMLHGCTQSPDDFAAGTAMNALAEAEGFFVAYPAQSGRANGQKCWNWFQPGDQARESGEAAIIAGITRAVMAEHPVDPRRVYIAGFSAGAAAAANIARAYPDLYAAVGVHSGLAAGCARDLSSAMMAMNGGAPGASDPNAFGAPHDGIRVPTIVFHGDGDTTVNPRNGDQVITQAGAAALRPVAAPTEETSRGGLAYTRTRYADEAGHVRVERWLVRGSGHAWSGGSPAGSYTDPRGPDASRAMLDFFLTHPLTAGQA